MRLANLRVVIALLSSVAFAACADSHPKESAPPPSDLPTYVSQAPASSSSGTLGATNGTQGGNGAVPAGAGTDSTLDSGGQGIAYGKA